MKKRIILGSLIALVLAAFIGTSTYGLYAVATGIREVQKEIGSYTITTCDTDDGLTYTTDDTATEQEVAEVETADATMSITYDNGFNIAGDIVLTGENGNVVITIPDGAKVSYDSTSSLVSMNDGAIKVRVTTDAASTDMHRFYDEDGQKMYLSQEVVVSDGVVVSIVAETTEDDLAANIEMVQTLAESVRKYSGSSSATLFTLPANVDTWTHVMVSNDYVVFDNGEESVCVSPFTQEITGAGFDKELDVGETWKWNYSSIVDAETGLKPYLVKVDGTTYKFVAKNNDSLTSLFG
jgi:hypothetical protein